MVKNFEQLSLFTEKSPGKCAPLESPVKKVTSSPFPNILLNSLSKTDAQENAVYYLRVINKSSQKRFLKTGNPVDRKIFFLSVFNEIKLKQGQNLPFLCCRDAIFRQTLLSKNKESKPAVSR